MQTPDERLARELWRALGGSEPGLPEMRLFGDVPVLPSTFHVGRLATASVAVATGPAAEVWAVRTGAAARPIEVERRHASAAFCLERHMKAEGWQLPPIWDPI